MLTLACSRQIVDHLHRSVTLKKATSGLASASRWNSSMICFKALPGWILRSYGVPVYFSQNRFFTQNIGTLLAGHGLLTLHIRALNHQQRTQLFIGRACLDLHLGYSSNRGQRLATKTHGENGEQVLCPANFGGSMALRLIRASVAVIPRPSSITWIRFLPASFTISFTVFAPASIEFSINPFTSRGRPLNNFTGRYLVGNGIGQKLDNIAHEPKCRVNLVVQMCEFYRRIWRLLADPSRILIGQFAD